MFYVIISKCSFILLAFCIIAKISSILTYSFCDESSFNTPCNCSALKMFEKLPKQCKCSLTSKEFKIACPETNSTLNIEVKQTNFSERIHIRCHKIYLDEEFEKLLPSIKLGNIEDLTIDRCPIGNITDILQLILGVTNYENLVYAIHMSKQKDIERLQFTTNKLREYIKLREYQFFKTFFELESFGKLYVNDINTGIYKIVSNFQYTLKEPRFILQLDFNRPMNVLLGNLELIAIFGSLDDQLIMIPPKLPPNLFANMPKLRAINIGSVFLMPEDLLASSTNIETIRIFRCLMKDLSNNIFESMHNLRELMLVNIKLYSINELSNQTHIIKESQLTAMMFSSIILQHTPNLQQLKLTYSYLESNNIEFEQTFSNHSAIDIIDLSNNQITFIPENWHIPRRLKELAIKDNQIFVLSAMDLKHLIAEGLYLDLSYNKINTVNFKNLEIVRQLSNTNLTINLEHNPIHCDCDILNFILYLRHDIGEYIWNNIIFITNFLSCDAPHNLKKKLLQQFDLNCYTTKDVDIGIHPLDLICPLHPSVCPNNCDCWRRDHDQQLVVNCTSIGITRVPNLPIIGLDDLTGIKPHIELHERFMASSLSRSLVNANPTESPELTGIELYLENNQLLELPSSSEPGYANVTKLYLAGNNITNIEKLQLPLNLTYLDLRNNHLQSLNYITLKYLQESTLMQQIFLSKNPWNCECNNESINFLRFVIKNSRLVNDSQEMFCNNTQKYFFEQQDLCSKNRIITKLNDFNIMLGIVCTIGLLVGSVIAVYYKYQRELKIWLYAHNWCLWFVTAEELDQDKTYDAFISYSSKDEQFVYDHLVPELENGSPSFKLCVYDRDWLVGECIPDLILRSVKNSKRTIVVLSQNFIESVWAKMEFKAAHQSALNEGRAKVIVIMYGDIEDMHNLDEDLKAYLKINIYLKWNDLQFWNKLRYAMPHSSAREYSELELLPIE